MRKWIAAAAGLLFSILPSIFPVTAQVQQSGTVTAGHAAYWVTNGVIGDAGTAAAGNLTSIGVTNNGGPGVCVNSGPTTGAYNQLCLSASQTGGGTITLTNIGGATGGFNFVLNGTSQGFPTVSGTPVVANNLVCFFNTSGTLKDCGLAPGGLTVANHNVAIGTGATSFNGAAPGASGTLLTSNGAAADPSFQAFTGAQCPASQAGTLGCVFSLTATTGSVLSGINNSGQPTQATTMVLTSSSSAVISVGRQGATQPAFNVNASAATSITGISIASQASAAGVDITSTGSGSEPIRITPAGNAALIINANTGGTTLNGNTNTVGTGTITSQSTNALSVGRQGATNPAFLVNSNIGSSVTGITVVANIAGSGVNMAAISSGAAENFTINALGTGTITLGNVSTGAITLTRATTVSAALGVSSTTTVTAQNASALAVGRQGATNPALAVDSSNASHVNGLVVTGTASGVAPFILASGSVDTNIGIGIITKGNLPITFATASGTNQVQIIHTASTTNLMTLTGSNGGNPTISTSGGNLAITPALVGGSYLQTATTTVGSLPTCNAGTKGAHHFVTDSNAASYTAGIGAIVAAGGTTNVPVTCDGTNWRIG